jgi:hypothetical protein
MRTGANRVETHLSLVTLLEELLNRQMAMLLDEHFVTEVKVVARGGHAETVAQRFGWKNSLQTFVRTAAVTSIAVTHTSLLQCVQQEACHRNGRTASRPPERLATIKSVSFLN